MNVRNTPCPWLPEVGEIHGPHVTRRHGGAKGAMFYQDALRYAQSQWIYGKPAQAILQINKAWMAELEHGHAVLVDFPPPYRALGWILRSAADGGCGFLGNPVRHFQHLATRVSGPGAELRAWRAWVCFHLAERHLGGGDFPRDGVQLVREGLALPRVLRACREVERLGWMGEMVAIRAAWDD